MQVSHSTFSYAYMDMAVEQARIAASLGEVPVGAVMVLNNEIVAMNYNHREIQQNPLAHAEMSVIDESAKRLGTWRLTGTTLYVTLEPCIMCAGAIIQARITNLVYGSGDPKAGACGSLVNVLEIPQLNHRVNVISGVRQDACGEILRTFFKTLRTNHQIMTR